MLICAGPFKGSLGEEDKIVVRRILVLVNPVAGAGKALHIANSSVLPMLTEAGIECDLKITAEVNALCKYHLEI